MIEVIAKLSQGAYLAGEKVEVTVTFRNPSPPPDAKSQWNDQEEILAWASAQIHCQCWVNPNRVKSDADAPPSVEEKAVTNSRTSFAPCHTPENVVGGNGPTTSSESGFQSTSNSSSRVVISTKPTILFCDLRLLPGESKTCKYAYKLDLDGLFGHLWVIFLPHSLV